MQVLSYFPGQIATIFLEVTDGYNNVREDSSTTPVVVRIFKPDLTYMDGYIQPMDRLDTGLYRFQFTIPTGASAVGSYLVDVAYTDPDGFNSSATFQVVVTAPFGNFGVTIG